MNISQIIEELQKILAEHGDCEVIVSGCYGSTGEIQEIYFEENPKISYLFLDGKGVILGSNICSG